MLSGFEQLVTVPPGKLHCYVTGKLRRDTPEEQARQRVARSLVEEYGYHKEDISLQHPVDLGRNKKRVDVVVFESGRGHTQDNAVILAQVNPQSTKPSDGSRGVEQLHGYLVACPNARWGLWMGSELRAYRKLTEAGCIRFELEPDIPPFGKDRPPRLERQQLISADSLKPVFRRIHNYIYANQGLAKDQAFHELLKIIFCKVRDEESAPGTVEFDVDPEERLSVLGQKRLRSRMEGLFEHVKREFPDVFDRQETIKLDDRVLAYAVSELRRYSLLKTPTDVKGKAYQELVRDNLRGDRGEFFTPDPVCAMAARMVLAMFPVDRWQELRILDPACGTGGLLRAVISTLRGAQSDRAEPRTAPASEREASRDGSNSSGLQAYNVFGIDLNPLLVRTTRMNLSMHGVDGVFEQANSLLPQSEWSERLRREAPLGSMDVVLTNPPFGSGPGLSIDDAHVLGQYELARFGPTRGTRRKMPPEQLFIERCYQFLKPGGVLAIVLPDSILSNPGLEFIRQWMLQRFKVVASVDLPVETFIAFGGTGTQTSVLILQRKTEREMDIERRGGAEDYEIFMAVPRTMGYDRRGNDSWRRTPEGDIECELVMETLPDGREREMERAVRDDEVSEVPELFVRWLREPMNRAV
jgi:type I restriction enzyme M protein